MQGFQPACSTGVARRLQDRGENGRAVFEIAEGVRTGDREKRDREPLRPASQTSVYRGRSPPDRPHGMNKGSLNEKLGLRSRNEWRIAQRSVWTQPCQRRSGRALLASLPDFTNT